MGPSASPGTPSAGGATRGRAGGSFTSYERQQAVRVNWEELDHITPKWAVVTGEEGSEDAKPKVDDSRPMVVFVYRDPDTCDGKCGDSCQVYFKFTDNVLKSEKVALGTRAFRTIRISEENAAQEPLLEGRGVGVPRLVFIDPRRDTSVVLEHSKVQTSHVYGAMRRVASKFYKESFERAVKSHLKLLVELDKLGMQEYTLREQKSLADNDKRADKLARKLEEVEAEQEALREKQRKLWDMTPKDV